VGKAAGGPTVMLIIVLATIGLTAVAGWLVGWLAGFGWAFYAVGFGGLFVAVFGFLAGKDLTRYRRHRRLRAVGTAAAARVAFVYGMKESTMGVPLLLYRLLVLPTSGGPFEAYSLLHADAQTRARLAPGALVVVRVEPADHTNVAVELD
jgi:hypothetical protein